MKCPICNQINSQLPRSVYSIEYMKCTNCDTIYATESIDSEIQTENDSSDDRNKTEHNTERINRVLSIETIKTAVDFGCGSGALVKMLEDKGISAVGIDQGNGTTLEIVLTLEYIVSPVDAIFMVEVLEHLADPRYYLAQFHNKLKAGGLLYVETSFSDSLGDAWDLHKYVNPRIGHRVIMSVKAFSMLFTEAGFILEKQINQHAFILRTV